MELMYPAFTIVMFIAAALCARHAIRTNRVSFCIQTFLYGLILEKGTILLFERYTYPAEDYFFQAFQIPFAIGLGWTAAIYSAYVFTEAAGFSRRVAPFAAGLFALHIDLSMDIIAIRVPFWTWTPAGVWFGVPLGNFFGWFVVTVGFVACYDFIKDRNAPTPIKFVFPIVGSIAILMPLLEVWNGIVATSQMLKYIVSGGLLLFSFGAIASEFHSLSPTELPIEALSATGLYHSFFLLLYFWLGISNPMILVVSLAMIVVAVLIHCWLSGESFSQTWVQE